MGEKGGEESKTVDFGSTIMVIQKNREIPFDKLDIIQIQNNTKQVKNR